ncbi:MAG TPA: hypothetical protein P5077_11070, partial [bacterium]|nr:hypothetical protein [bacterium]
MNYRRSLALATFASLVTLLSACSAPQDDRVSCVTSFDCPLGWFCEDYWCVQNPDQSAGSDTKNDIDTSVDIYTAEDDTLPDTAEGSDLNDDGVIPDEQGDDAVIVDDTDEPPVEGDALIPDDDTGATDDGTDTDTATDEDLVTDTATDADAVPPNTGATCSVAGDCVGGATCGQIFTGQTTSYCYLSCAWPNESICAGTDWPECAVIGSWALCLATATVGGNFTTTVDANPFVEGNNVSLTINGANTMQAGCTAFLSSGNWFVQCTKSTPNGGGHIQLDAIFYWPQANHTVGVVTGAQGRVYETTYDAGGTVTDNWVRAIFTVSDGTVTLTAAGTTTGSAVSG